MRLNEACVLPACERSGGCKSPDDRQRTRALARVHAEPEFARSHAPALGPAPTQALPEWYSLEPELKYSATAQLVGAYERLQYRRRLRELEMLSPTAGRAGERQAG